MTIKNLSAYEGSMKNRNHFYLEFGYSNFNEMLDVKLRNVLLVSVRYPWYMHIKEHVLTYWLNEWMNKWLIHQSQRKRPLKKDFENSISNNDRDCFSITLVVRNENMDVSNWNGISVFCKFDLIPVYEGQNFGLIFSMNNFITKNVGASKIDI